MARLSDSITYGNHAVTGDVDVGGTLTVDGAVFSPVSITGSTGITVTGTYPNFTVSADDTAEELVSTITTNTTAVAFTFYNITAVLTLTLPSAPAVGDWVRVSNFSGGSPIVARNGNNIMGLAEDMTIDQPKSAITLTYVSTTQGWIIS